MCVLCDKDNLRLLAAPLAQLSHRELADAISIAREAAWQLVLDTADTFAEFEPETSPRSIGADGYGEYVIERALSDGVLTDADVARWNADLEDGTALEDPRVQAFLSSAAEGLSTYILQIAEHKKALELFLEERDGGVSFAGVGPNAEIIFQRGDERYVVLHDDEALRIAIDSLATRLCREDPHHLIEFTNLPVGAADVLASMQQEPPARANDILAGIVDLHALAEDRVRQVGYAPFIAEGITEEYAEQRFGDRIIVRLRMPPEGAAD